MKPEMRQKFVVGNWKMHTTAAEARQLARAVVHGMGIEDHVSVAVCPPFPYLALVGEILKGSRVALGAQNLYPEKEGAFTVLCETTLLSGRFRSGFSIALTGLTRTGKNTIQFRNRWMGSVFPGRGQPNDAPITRERHDATN